MIIKSFKSFVDALKFIESYGCHIDLANSIEFDDTAYFDINSRDGAKIGELEDIDDIVFSVKIA